MKLEDLLSSSLMCLLARLSLIEHLTSSPPRPFHRLPKHPHTRAAGFPKKTDPRKRDQNGSYSLLQPNLGSDIPSVLPYSVGPIDQPWYNVEGDDTNSVNMRGWRALGAILEPTKPLI